MINDDCMDFFVTLTSSGEISALRTNTNFSVKLHVESFEHSDVENEHGIGSVQWDTKALSHVLHGSVQQQVSTDCSPQEYPLQQENPGPLELMKLNRQKPLSFYNFKL